MKILSCVFPVKPGKPAINAEKMIHITEENPADIYLFPAYSLVGSTCGALLEFKFFQEECDKAVDMLCKATEDNGKIIVTSVPKYENIVIRNGDILKNNRFTLEGKEVAVSETGNEKGDVLLLPTIMPGYPCIQNDIIEFCAKASANYKCVVAMANGGFGESAADNVYKGMCGIFRNGIIVDFKPQDLPETIICAAEDTKESGIIYTRNKGIDYKMPYYGKNEPKRWLGELFKLQTQALYTRLESSGLKKVAVNVSGGLDSTLALLVAESAMKMAGYPAKDIYALTLPCFGTGERTKGNAEKLMELVGATAQKIDIKAAVTAHLEDIGHNVKDENVVFENAQARERAQILMDVANIHNALALGTGDMSEAALGWCTYGGDTMCHYNVNATVPKTVVREVVKMIAEERGGQLGDVLRDIVDTPISPELKQGQVTEDIVGPYELHDFFMFYFAKFKKNREEIRQCALATFDEYSDEEIEKWLDVFFTRFSRSQFKRSSAPEGANLLGFTLPYIPTEINPQF